MKGARMVYRRGHTRGECANTGSLWLGWAYLAKKMQSPQPRPSQPPSNSVIDTEKWAPESAADRS
jgi:hypothetical protein